MDTPSWLTDDYIKHLIEDNNEFKINILHYTIESPIQLGSNYSSHILRLRVKYTIIDQDPDSTEDKSFIIKIPRLVGVLSSLTGGGIFKKELRAYKILLPKLKEIIVNSGDADIFAKYYRGNKKGILVLNDLELEDYSMLDRRTQLDYEHGVLIMKSLAMFHAATFRLNETEPERTESFKSNLLFSREMNDSMKITLDPMIGREHIAMICHEFRRFPETSKFVSFLLKLKRKFWDVYLQAIHSRSNELAMLVHGDLWTNNLLFQYDEDSKPKSVKFIDFQLIYESSPTVDILNFFHTSIRYDVLKDHFNDLTNIYLENLNLYLEKYGSSERLVEEEFKNSLRVREIFSLIQCVNVLPYCFADFHDLDNNAEDESLVGVPVEGFLDNKIYRDLCVKYLEDFSTKSWFINFD